MTTSAVRPALTKPWHAEKRLPCTPENVAVGRHWLTEVLTRILARHGCLSSEDKDRIDSAEVALSEVLTNAHDHSRSGLPGGKVKIVVTVNERLIRIGVEDAGSDELPRAKVVDITERGWAERSERCRGLPMVELLVDEWGRRPLAGGRQEVFFAIERTAA